MKTQKASSLLVVLFILALVQYACGALVAEPIATSTPQPTATETLVPTETSTPTATPRPTRTPNLTATQRIEDYNAEVQKYFDLGYLSTVNGRFIRYGDRLQEDWAQLGWYQWWVEDDTVSDFFMSAHFEWSSAYRSADDSGCGFVFAVQENDDHYAVFLDRSHIIFLDSDSAYYYSRNVGLTSGTGRVKFANPADQRVEADFTIIVMDAYTYVLVDGEVVGEYTLSQSKILRGKLGTALLSGTNKGYGTRCTMTNTHVWIPD